MGKWLLLILTIVVITINPQNAYADDNIISFKKTMEEHRGISSAVGISVNSKEEIALGFSGKLYDNTGHINVYDSNGKFIHGYSLETSGSYLFEYDETDNIMIFSVRSGICYFFNTDEKLVKTREFFNATEEDRYRRSLLDNKKVEVNGGLYELSAPFGYTKLIKTDVNGNITTIYDIGWDYAGVILGRVVMLLFIIGLFIYCKNFKG